MTKDDEKILKLFQCEDIRLREEDFARTMVEEPDLRVHFINENCSHTDGENIVLDPGQFGLFCDNEALMRTEEYLHMSPVFSKDHWKTIKIMTRADNLHECLHLMFTNFPGVLSCQEAVSHSEKMLLSMISNIIEDAFVDGAGCSMFDHFEKYIVWKRVLTAYRTVSGVSTMERILSVPKRLHSSNDYRLRLVLEYMTDKYIYPMLPLFHAHGETADMIQRIDPLFERAVVCVNADERDEIAVKIFQQLREWLNQDAFSFPDFPKLLPGSETHGSQSVSLKITRRSGKKAKITRRAFSDLQGHRLSMEHIGKELEQEAASYEEEKKQILELMLQNGSVLSIPGSAYQAARLHDHIEIKEVHPRANPGSGRAYDHVTDQHKLAIHNYQSRLYQLLRKSQPQWETKQRFGTGISSKNFTDPKKRYWYRKELDPQVPELAVMLMIDGSASMAGERRREAMTAAIILHEVLKKNRITHAIVEHRAIYEKPVLLHNVLIGFQEQKNEKYNLLNLDAKQGTREGLSLFWAEQYLMEHTREENRLILMISDGEPEHISGPMDLYVPPVSVTDTASAVRKITRRGTKIVAMAMDDPGQEQCYEELREIYPAVVECTNLDKLAGQLFRVISAELK